MELNQQIYVSEYSKQIKQMVKQQLVRIFCYMWQVFFSSKSFSLLLYCQMHLKRNNMRLYCSLEQEYWLQENKNWMANEKRKVIMIMSNGTNLRGEEAGFQEGRKVGNFQR